MRHRSFGGPVGAYACALLLVLVVSAGSRSSATPKTPSETNGERATGKPNVLLVIVDDLRPLLGAYGHQNVQTPHFDALAERGLLFRRAYVQQAWCAPSRTSMLTGLRPDSTRVYDLVTHFRTTVPDIVTLPQQFKRHGYFTAAFGKVYHRGMDDSLSWTEGTWEPDVADPLKHYVLDRNQRIAVSRDPTGYAAPTESASVPDTAYADGLIADRAIGTLERMGDRPFFLAVGFYKPHMPFNAPQRYWDRYERSAMTAPSPTDGPEGAAPLAFMKWKEHHNYLGIPDVPNGEPLPDSTARRLRHGYRAAISYVDAQFGRLLEALEREGHADETMVVALGDHGWKLGEYQTWSKHTLYEIDTRVPLLIDRPGEAGGATDAIVELLDLYPTLTDLAGLPTPEHVQGRTLRYLFENPAASGKEAAYSQFIRNGDRTYTTYEDAVAMGQAVRTDRYRLIRWIRRDGEGPTSEVELYDHRTDPEETVNVAGREPYQETVDRLIRLADQRFRDPFPSE